MKVGRLATHLEYSLIAVLALVIYAPALVFAQQDHASAMNSQHHQTPTQKKQLNALVKVVREATEQFKDVTAAEAAGYHLLFGCVSGPDAGAMGMHFVKMPLVGDGEVKADEPEIVIYEPQPNGRLRLIGADYLVFAADWDKKHPGTTPDLMGQLFHYFEAPNRFGLPPFYTLHVWAWKESPTGTFVNWNHNVSCDAFKEQN